MSGIKKIRVKRVLSLGTILFLFAGCDLLKQHSTPETVTVTVDSATLAESLNLRIVRAADGDVHVPDPGADLSAPRVEDKITSSGDQAVFENNIYLADAQNTHAPFLVWSADWLGGQIQEAVFEHRLVDEKGQPLGDPERKQAIYDTETRRWSLAFSEFVTSDAVGADPARQHLLTLDLHLSDQSRKIIHIKLRVIGAVPRLGVEALNLSTLLDAAVTPGDADYTAESHQALHEGLVVRAEHLANPTDRTLKLWLRAEPAEHPESARPVELAFFIGQKTYHQDAITPYLPDTYYEAPVANPVRWSPWSAGAQVSAVQLTWADETPKIRLELKSGAWTSVELAPQSKVLVEWLALPVDRSGDCKLPPLQARTLSWWNRKVFCLGQYPIPEDCRRAETSQASFAEPWLIGGWHLQADWREGMVLTNPWQRTPTFLTSAGPNPAPLVSRTVVRSRGVTPAPESLGDVYACTGLF